MKNSFATIGTLVLLAYFITGFIFGIYVDYEYISNEGFWDWFWWGRDEVDGMYKILFWPYYMFFA